jgi:hypothetical protein
MEAWQMAKWKIGKVMSVNIPGADDPYGFTVFKEGGEPIVIFVYPTPEACESAAKHIGLALEEVVSVNQYRRRAGGISWREVPPTLTIGNGQCRWLH